MHLPISEMIWYVTIIAFSFRSWKANFMVSVSTSLRAFTLSKLILVHLLFAERIRHARTEHHHVITRKKVISEPLFFMGFWQFRKRKRHLDCGSSLNLQKSDYRGKNICSIQQLFLLESSHKF